MLILVDDQDSFKLLRETLGEFFADFELVRFDGNEAELDLGRSSTAKRRFGFRKERWPDSASHRLTVFNVISEEHSQGTYLGFEAIVDVVLELDGRCRISLVGEMGGRFTAALSHLRLELREIRP